MSTVRRFKMLAAAMSVVMVMAMAFTLSCSSDDDDGGGPDDGGGTKSSYTITFNANGGTVSPTSAKTGDDGKLTSLPTPTRSGYTFDGWFTAATGGTAVTVSNVYSANATIYARWTAELGYIGKGSDISNYKTIVIGTQKWMAENLDNDVAGSVCYNNRADSCAKYGRLYNWEDAKSACPAGWHLPSDDEWTALTDAVGGKSVAGKKLKSRSGWYNNGNGTDDYGFAALPGGGGSSDDGFRNAGRNGIWWSATEYGALGAWSWGLGFGYDMAGGGSYDQSELLSVRCVED